MATRVKKNLPKKSSPPGSKIIPHLASQRIIIENVTPQIDGGMFPIKRIIQEPVTVKADIFADGHDEVNAQLLYKTIHDLQWQTVFLKPLGNDLWQGEFLIEKNIPYVYTVEGWMDEFATWHHKFQKLCEAQQDINLELIIGANLFRQAAENASGFEAKTLFDHAQEFKDKKYDDPEVYLTIAKESKSLMSQFAPRPNLTRYEKELTVTIDPPKALFSSWYEFFPRSWSQTPGQHGTFKDCERLIPEIKRLGFDVIYFPPIHPIGRAFRKGKNNSLQAGENDPGSPWAIGSEEGGHKDILRDLGTLEDFKSFIKKAAGQEIDIAMDIAFQCSPDHPYVKKHPEWFIIRPDGTIQYAENPPKKYQDIYPINFSSKDATNLWEELKGVFLYWCHQGIRIFRVDNPHTKPFSFWQWVIAEIKKDYPDTIFLSEAFTRPKIMKRLAKVGFTQSYTYFTWRTSKAELIKYMKELTRSEQREYFRPNFWPNTPDILAYHLQEAPRQTFIIRLLLAATLSSNYGIYGPAFELCENDPVEGKEEYNQSEKYEIKTWDWDRPGNLKEMIARINQIRHQNPALQTTWNLEFYDIHNDQILAYGKWNDEKTNILLVIINLDPLNTQSGWVSLPLHELGLDDNHTFRVKNLISNDTYFWQGSHNYVEINPFVCPGQIMRIEKSSL
ncbi:MAG: alpha-1,4-glucan--maltose-1-phosphate maltosyltransferase [Candidatus Omnitrophica bacterium]|nr:alpha-1,4-glucan--maltose-1-phosphate maltosyltransferase [Candidatus Omnitrophota bacterium]